MSQRQHGRRHHSNPFRVSSNQRVLLSAFQYPVGNIDTCSTVQGLALLPSDPSRLMAPLHIQVAHASFVVVVFTFEDLPPAYAPLLLRTDIKMWLFTLPSDVMCSAIG